MKPKMLLIGAAVLVPMLLLGLVLSVVLLFGSTPAAADCGPTVSVVKDSDTKVEGYSADQLKNAAAIMGAGKALNLPAKGQMISVMVALGESGLRVLDHGDGAGPGLPGVVPAARQRRVGFLRGPHEPHHQRHELHQGPAEGRGLGAVGTDHCRQQGPAQRRPVPLPEVLARGRQDSSRHSRTRSSPWKAATAPFPGSPARGMTTRGRTPRPGCRPARTLQHVAAGHVLPRMRGLRPLAGEPADGFSTSAPFKFLNGTFRPDGQGLGSALTWKAGWDAKGWPTGNTPRVGAVVWYAPGAGGADPTYGHVAVVKEVKDDGTYVEEGYNGNPPPDDHNYYTRTVSNDVPSALPVPAHPRGEEVKKPLALLAVALLCAVVRTGSEHHGRRPAAASQPRTPSAPVSLSASSGPQAPGRHRPGHHRHHLGPGQQGRGHGRRGEGHGRLRPPRGGGQAVGQRLGPLADPAGHRRLLGGGPGQHPRHPRHRPGHAERR